MPLPARDPLAARAVDSMRETALARRHRQDDRLDAGQLALVDLEPLQLVADTRDHREHALQRAHLAQHLVAGEEVVERELAGAEARLHLRLLVLGDGRLRLLDQRQDVAHAEDPRGHPVGVEPLELVELLAGRGELDRPAGDRAHGQRRAAAGVAVELRQDDPVERDLLLECLRDVARPPGRSSRRGRAGRSSASPARRSARAPPSGRRRPGGGRRCRRSRRRRPAASPTRRPSRAAATGSSALLAVDRNLDLPCRAARAGRSRPGAAGRRRRAPGVFPSLRSISASLAAAVVLPEPWRPASRITVGPRGAKASRESPPPIIAVSSSWTIFTTCWPGRQALRHVLADRALLHAGDEVLHHLEVDVGLEQREADLAHRLRDRFLVEPAASAEVAEGVLELVGERVEHGRGRVPAGAGPKSAQGRLQSTRLDEDAERRT